MGEEEDPKYVRSNGGRDKKLRSICVLSRVRHTKQACFAMLQFEILIGKFGSIDGLSARACRKHQTNGIEEHGAF